MRLVRYANPNARSLAPVYGFSSRSPWTGLEDQIDQLFESALSGFVAGVGADAFSG